MADAQRGGSGAADALSASLAAAVEAVRTQELELFTSASTQLAAHDLEQVGALQAAVIRSMLEQLYPDGLDADDVRAVLVRCEQAAAWWPEVDLNQLLLVFSGALGLLDADDQPPDSVRPTLTRHASIVIAELSASQPELVADHLRLAVSEVRRAETMELP